MTWKRGQKNDRGKKSSWSGGDVSPDAPRHRWQDATRGSDVDRTRRRRSQNRWIVTTVMGLALLGFLIWWLRLWRSPPTPVVFITATKYEAPVPINAWALEDRKALESLNGTNLSVPEHLPDWNESGSRFELFPKSFDPNKDPADVPLIVYISAHGIVNNEGKPCLLPPGVSVDEPKRWIQVSRLISEIGEKVSPARDTLLVLDCNRIRENWSLGIVYNAFADRVMALVEEKNNPRLAVLLSAGPGQVNWTSADLRGSVFARYFQLGLAGAADAKINGGNKDGQVSLDELTSYVQHEVSAWSQSNRGELQEPMLVPKGAHFHVTYSLRSGAQLKLAEALEKPEKQDALESADKDKQLWSQLDDLRNRGLVRCDPVACRNFEHNLLRLEELTQGGEAYADELKTKRREVEEGLKKATTQSIPSGSLSAAKYYGMTSDANWLNIKTVGFTLPACEYFGICGAKDSETIRMMWKRLVDAHLPDTADSIVGGPDVPKIAVNLAETQFRAALQQQQVASLWQDKATILDVVELRTKAEELAVPREPDGKPGDERAHYFTRFAAAKADSRRRLVEDLLFVGEQNLFVDEPNPQKKYRSAVQDTKDLYGWTSEVMKDASSAFQVRDDVFAKGPYLAEWLCDPLSAEVPERDKLVSTNLIPLFQRAHELNETINNTQQLQYADYMPSGANLPFRKQSEQVQTDLAAIQAKYDAALKSLADHETSDAAEWRQLEAALRTPLIPAATRETLLKKRAKLTEILQQEFFEAKHAPNENGHEKKQAPDALHDEHELAKNYLETAHQWAAHPLFEILHSTPPPPEQPLKWSYKASAAARDELKKRAPAKPEKKDVSGTGAADKIATARNRLSEEESELRAKAALTYEQAEHKTEDNDPIRELRRFDIQQLLIWNGQRAIADFWQNTVKTDSTIPYYARAATGYFQAASEVSKSPISAPEQLPSKTEWVPIVGSVQPAGKDEQSAVVSLDIGGESDALRPRKGFASVYLRHELRRLVKLPLQTDPPGHAPYIDISTIGGKAQRFDANIVDPSEYSSALQGVTFFRGRESKTDDLRLPNINDIRVEYVPHVPKEQSITLSGDQFQRSSIDFILDCSGSMKELTSIKGDKKGTAERLSLAKMQLKAMLDELVERNSQGEDIHVGVRFYGHRVGWINGVKNGPIAVQDGYQNDEQVLRQKGPSKDIEEALPLGKFTDTENDIIKKRITSLKPYGETPLYLALKETLSDFQAKDLDSRKYIVAITDGMNDSTDPTGIPEVIAVWQNLHVPIYILGFDIKAEELKLAEPAFNELTTTTGGQFFKVTNGSDLLAKLKETLRIDMYSVSDSGRPPTRLGDRTLINLSQLPKDFTVSFRSANKPVHLEGGEAIALRVTDNGQDIKADRYKNGVEQKYLQGGARKSVLLRAHRPIRDEKAKGSVSFPISIQVDPDVYHFTARPRETWVEITPLTDNVSAGQPYVFYDVNFELDEPVPLLKWTALKWPKNANRACIRFWCKDEKTRPAQTIPLRDLFNKNQLVAGVELSAKSSSEGDQYAIRVDERHGPQSPGIDDLHVRLETQLNYKPRRVIHQFNAELGIVKHTFEFPATMRENIERPDMARVVVTRGTDMKDGALQLPPEGVNVNISADADVFSPEAASTGR